MNRAPLLTLVVALTAACSSKSSPPAPPPSGATSSSSVAAAAPKPPGTTSGKTADDVLGALEGSCERGLFSPDGQKVLLICSGREAAPLAQLYELNLATQQERRITWQDGVVGSADWLNDDRVVYSSTTDELKEIPFLNVKLATDNIPSEIYESDRVGSTIERLTHHPGFDGDVSVDRRSGGILFVSRTGNNEALMKILSPKQGALVAVPAQAIDRRSPARLSKGLIGWLEATKAGKGADLRTSEAKKPVRLKDRLLLSLRPAPSGVGWIAVESVAPAKSRVLFVGESVECEKNLLEGEGDYRFADAALAPTPRLIVATAEGTRQRLTLKDLPGETFTCAAPAAPAKVEK